LGELSNPQSFDGSPTDLETKKQAIKEKENWRLHWGTDCFLVSLVSLALIACFLVSESVGDPSRLSGFESSLKILVLFQNFVFTDILALYP
jgi:hypothetical protein